MEAIEFISTSPVRGDCMQSYDILIHDKHIKTVKDLIEIIVYKSPSNWGDVYISQDDTKDVVSRCFGENISCSQYEYGGFVTNVDTLTKFYNNDIVKVTADGGWSRFDYCIVIK